MFELVHCPRCGAATSGKVCDVCGAPLEANPLPRQDVVIDVHAEPVGNAADQEETCDRGIAPSKPRWGREVPVFKEGSWERIDKEPFFTFQMRRRDASGPGCCCSVGCLFVFLFVLMALRGCLSLF